MHEQSQPQSGKLTPKRIASISACVLWIASLGASFAIPGSSPWIWVPDALLLIGFFPLLFVWSPSWPWIVFGILNTFIGFFLVLLSCMEDSPFPVALHQPKHHLVEYHPWTVWGLIGVLATAYGIFRLTKNVALLMAAKVKRSS